MEIFDEDSLKGWPRSKLVTNVYIKDGRWTHRQTRLLGWSSIYSLIKQRIFSLIFVNLEDNFYKKNPKDSCAFDFYDFLKI